jgi:hypothetical protein
MEKILLFYAYIYLMALIVVVVFLFPCVVNAFSFVVIVYFLKLEYFMTVPDSYPFKPVNLTSRQPLWHPNVELFSGRTALPLEWSPVLTLQSIAMAVQVRPLSLSLYLILFSLYSIAIDAHAGTEC